MSNEEDTHLYVENLSDDEDEIDEGDEDAVELPPLFIDAPGWIAEDEDEEDPREGVAENIPNNKNEETPNQTGVWSSIDPSHFEIPECEYIVNKDSKHDFQYLRIRIHKALRHIICLGCGNIVHPNALAKHLSLKHCYKDVDEKIGQDLVKRYSFLETMDSKLNHVTFPLPPIVGIPLYPHPLHFCGVCHRGYSTIAAFKMHSSKAKPRHERGFMDLKYLSYSQKITGCSTSIYIAVDIGTLIPDPDLSARQINRLGNLAHGEQNYSKMAIKLPTDDLSMTSFFRSHNWTRYLEGYTPEELTEARRMYVDEDPNYTRQLRTLAAGYFGRIDKEIIEDIQFGLTVELATIRKENDTPMYNFSKLAPPSQNKYGLTITKLLFSCIRFYVCPNSWTTRFQLPQIPDKVKAGLVNLYTGLVRAGSLEDPILAKHKGAWTMDEKAIMTKEARAQRASSLLDLYHQALLLLFMHIRPPGEDGFYSPVIAFYIVHMYGDDGGPRPVDGLTGIAAHIMYVLRGCIGIQAQRDAKDQNVSVADTLKAYEKYLKGFNETVLGFFYHSLRFLVPLRRLEGNKSAFILADSSMDKMIYKSVAFYRTDLKAMIEAQLVRYDFFLKKAVMYGETVVDGTVFPIVNFTTLFDDLGNSGRGYTFITDPGNNLLQYRTTYYDWLMSKPRQKKIWMSPNGDLRREVAMAWLKAIQPIEVMLAVGALLSAGPSPRNTEFVRQLYRQEGDSNRSLMILFQCLSLTSVTDKNSHQHMQDKFVPHIPSRSWSIRIVQHMATLRPFTEFLIKTLFPSDTDTHHHYHFQMWPTLTGTMSHRAFGNEMAGITYEHLKVSFRVKQWRQLTTLFAHRIQELVAFKYPQDLITDTLNMHSTRTSTWKYGGSAALGPGSDVRRLVRLVEGSLGWHKIMGIDQDFPLHCNAPTGVKTSQPIPAPTSTHIDLAPVMDHILRLENEIQSYKNALPEAVNRSVASAFVVHRTSKSVVASHLSAPAPPPTIFVQGSLLQAFRKFLKDKKAAFRTHKQGQLIALGYENKSNVLAILCTSSGKTAATIFLSSLSSLITVMFVPLVALRDNILDDAKRYGVRAAEFEEDNTNKSVHLLVFALEHLQKDAFEHLLTLKEEKRLKRVVFDEIHLFFTQKKYRDSFNLLHKLLDLGVPVIYLSASVPPISTPDLQRATRATWTMLREPSNRLELCYKLVVVKDRKSEANNTIAYIQDRIRTYGEKDRALIFCRSKTICMEVAEKLNVPAYYSNLDEGVRRDILDKWVEGNYKVLVNTPCLGTGFHYPWVRDVVHIAGAYSMLDQYQEDSRGGRDGSPSNAVIFFSLPLPSSSEYYTPDPVLHSWLEKSAVQCSRLIPSMYLDGEAVTCITLPGAQLCTFCELDLLRPLSDKVTLLPSRPSTPPLNLKRSLDLTPERILVSDKRKKDAPPSPEDPVIPSDLLPEPVTILRSDMQGALNAAANEASLRNFKNSIDLPLQQVMDSFHKYCVVCPFLPVNIRPDQPRHGTFQCQSDLYMMMEDTFHQQQFDLFNSMFKHDVHFSCTCCGLPIRPAGMHVAPLESGCPEKRKVIRTMLYLYFVLRINKHTNWVPEDDMQVILSFARWCTGRHLGMEKTFGPYPIFNSWVLAITIWDHIVNLSTSK